LAMAFTLVYTGEHFVIDEFVGWAYAVAAFFIGSRLLDRWQARKPRRKTGWRRRATESTPPQGAEEPDDRLVTVLADAAAAATASGHRPAPAPG